MATVTNDPLTELEDLRLFMQERVQSFDSSIATDTGSQFDSQVITPLIQRLSPDPYNTPIRDFILGRLAKEFPDLVLQDGEPIDDYAVKIMQILLEAYRRQIKQVSLNQSLANPMQLNEREADNLAANFFARRRLGGYSVGLARLYYSSPQYALITPSNAVYDAGGHRFYPVESQAIMADRMLFNEENGLYYFDAIVRAESQGKAYDIEPNSLTGVEGIPSCVKVTNKRKFEEGADKEETEAFIERVENGLTEKSLVTLRGIRARLLDTFDNIRLIQTIGFGDPEMKRDIIKGSSQTSPYAHFSAYILQGEGIVDLDLSTPHPFVTEDGITYNDFSEGGVQVGDIVEIMNYDDGIIDSFKILSLQAMGSPPAYTRLLVDGAFTVVDDNYNGVIRRPSGIITISDIPGGILIPTTRAGNIEISDGEVHIGGSVDVFIRAGTPQQRDINLTGILDGSPLHFGLDLESFGDAVNQRVHVTEQMTNRACIPAQDRFGDDLSTYDQIVIQIIDGSEWYIGNQHRPWVPTSQDVGRYIQLLGGNAPGDGGPDFGSFKILAILDKELFFMQDEEWFIGIRIKIDVTKDYESGSTTGPFLHPTTTTTQGVFDLSVRLLEEIPIKNRVRDRDNSTVCLEADDPNPGDLMIPGGVDFVDQHTKIGDSVVIETGDDAGIYSIRRILSWLGDTDLDSGSVNDTLILDRALTRSVTPSGSSGAGLRYRIADELNIDLVAPKITKIPLGDIFLGNDLSTVAGSTRVSVSGETNFLLAGVEKGDTLELLTGDNTGKYTIQEVSGSYLVLASVVPSSSFSQKFYVYKAFTGVTRPMVRVKSIELLDSNSQPTGIKIPYGDPIDARILGTLSNRAEGDIVESYVGELEDNGEGLYDVHDPSVDFVAEGVTTDHRLNVFSGSSINGYDIIAVGEGDGLPTNNHIRVAPVEDGGIAFRAEEENVHYSVGLPSSGYVRLYFLEPTSVEFTTGLKGGRLQSESVGATKEFRFSSVSGYSILPAGGSGEDTPRDIRLVRSNPEGGSVYESIVELTDSSRPSVFQLELQEGDVLEVNEQLQFAFERDLSLPCHWDGTTTVTVPGGVGPDWIIRAGMFIALKSDGQLFEVESLDWLGTLVIYIKNPYDWDIPTGTGITEVVSTFEQAGVFGKPTGLRTVSGSSLVEVPVNSLTDFVVMNRLHPLVGQILIVDSGPDAGRYTVEEVVSSKKLRLNKVMTATTKSVLGGGSSDRNATLIDQGTKSWIYDEDSGGQLKTNNMPGYFITIFESTRGDLDGSWEVKDLLTGPPDVANTIEIDTKDQLVNEGSDFESLDPQGVGLFNWVKTSSKTNIEQTFHIYKEVPTELEVVEVATKRDNWSYGVRRGTITGGTTIEDAEIGFSMDMYRGDLLEVLTGPSAGVYTLSDDTSGGEATIYGYPPFPVTGSNVPYRFWGGLHGSTKMVTVGPMTSFDGRLSNGESMPYRIRRSEVQRVSSTAMETSFDGLLYYVDVPIESQGAGDDFNLAAGSRLVIKSGVRADGYTYQVTSPREGGDGTVLTFSSLELVSLVFDRRFLPVGNSDSPENLTEVSGRNIRITYETSTPTRLVDELMRSDADRPINANPLARHFLPSYVFVNFEYAGGVTEASVGPDMENYINGLGSDTELEISDLEAMLTKRGATYVKHPITLVTVTHDLDRNLVVNRSGDKLGGLMTVPFNGTGRISCFFATVGEGLTLVRES